MKKWRFIGILLNKDSQKYLESLNAYSNWITYCNNIILVMNDGSDMAGELYLKYRSLIGTEVELKLTQFGITKDAIAVEISCKELNNTYISIIASAPGVRPNASKIETWIPLAGSHDLKGRVELYE